MDSLFATYASSDDEEEENHRQQQNPNLTIPSNSTSTFLSLPKPKSSSSLTFSLPPPKSTISQTLNNPNHQNSTIKDTPNPTKRLVVQFKPPIINPYSIKDDDDDDEDDRLAKRRNTEVQTHSLKSFLSSIPAPRNARETLGVLPTSSSRKSVAIDADIPALKTEKKNVIDETNTTTSASTGVYEENWVGPPESNAAYGALDGQSISVSNGGDSASWIEGNESYGNYDASYESYGSSGVGQYDSNLYDGSATAMQEMTKSLGKNYGKRGRNEIPTNIIEVKQDELMKNRPREDQVKATGIAFGPSYQPVSTKGKPTKLHKRKHQIGSLYFDMKQNETELSERRSKGMLTKAETHAKYGW